MMAFFRPVLLVAGVLVASHGAVQAMVMSTTSTIASCNTASGTATNCTSTAYFSTNLATATTSFIGGTDGNGNPALSTFTSAFTSWNDANGDQWTLVNGGFLAGLTLTPALQAGIGTNGAGFNYVIVNVSYTPTGNEPSLDQLVWTQGLYIDYTPTGGLGASEQTLDTYSLSAGSSNSGSAFTSACEPIPTTGTANNTSPSVIPATQSGRAYCDPIYPFQYQGSDVGASLDGTTLTSNFFYDAPGAPWPNGAFRGIALLSTVTYDTDSAGSITGRVLTVYDGISYGFSMSATAVPEPAAALVFGVGIIGALGARRRRASTGRV